ncbi:MAG: ABC transporter substrate-binding protein [Phaeospirillum sp.]|nr:ABC transporter substrate-binding protein [Phaeospirillum sp.]
MRLRWVLAMLGVVAVLALALLLQAMGVLRQKDVVIGVLNHGRIAELSLDGFKAGLSQYGYEEGRRVTYFYRGPLLGDALEEEARRLVGLKPDLLLALSTPAAKAGHRAAQAAGIPLVFAPASDPVGAGLADSLGRPGRNATGVTFGIQEPLRLQWLKTIVPKIRTVVVPYNPDDISPRLSVERIKPVAHELGITLDLRHVRNVAELEEVLASLPREVDAFFVPTDALVASYLPQILKASMGLGIPVTTVDRRGVINGALMSYGLDLVALGRQGARIAVQVLAGTPAGDLPIETAEFRLSINLETAQRLGVDIAESYLRQAELFRGGESNSAR